MTHTTERFAGWNTTGATDEARRLRLEELKETYRPILSRIIKEAFGAFPNLPDARWRSIGLCGYDDLIQELEEIDALYKMHNQIETLYQTNRSGDIEDVQAAMSDFWGDLA